MSRIFITGSADGLGLLAARLLVAQDTSGLACPKSTRGNEALHAVPGAEAVVSGDLSGIEETRHVAELVNDIGMCDAVIHNALSDIANHISSGRSTTCRTCLQSIP